MNEETERLHRPDLARAAPRREFSQYARTYGVGGAPRPPDPVADGVRLGYSVLDEQMQRGQRLAERLAPGRANAAAPDVGQLIARALDIYRDFGALAMAAAETLARNPTRAAQTTAARSAPPPSAGFALDIQSVRRVGVQLEWRAGERPATVRLGPLHGASGGRPIEDARFDGATLRLTIADDQASGAYHAVVVDAATGEAAGTLTVRVPD